MSYESYPQFEAYLAGTLSSEEELAFAESLDRDERLAAAFIEYMRLVTLTADSVSGRVAGGAAGDATFVSDAKFVEQHSDGNDSAAEKTIHDEVSWLTGSGWHKLRWPKSVTMAAFAVAASLLVAGLLWNFWPHEAPFGNVAERDAPSAGNSNVVRKSSVGSIAQQWKVSWTNRDEAMSNWTPLMVGDQFSLDSGEIEFNFHVGANVIVRGPARFEILASDQIKVDHGTLSARVSEGGRGFSVVTALGKVIDMGTEFGLQVDRDGATDVVVFEGMVDLESGGEVHHIDSGRAVRLTRNGGTSRIDQVEYDRFPRTTMYFYPPNSGEPVIRSIHDNLREDGVGPYYQISQGGLEEDCRAYVDRVYEWNGLDEAGLPDYLLGADYVLMFNDDKVREGFEIYLEMWRPADLYVFWDDRVPPPVWLQECFTPTGDRIGMDEGKSSLNGTQSVTAVGPGISVDYEFSVWRARIDDIREAFVLGSLNLDDSRHPSAVPSSMYGVAAVGRPASSAQQAD